MIEGLNHGSITSPNYPAFYGNNLNCSTTIVADKNSQLQVIMRELNLEPNSVDDYILIDNTFYFNLSNPIVVLSKNSINLKFVSDWYIYENIASPMGFKIEFFGSY